MQTHPEPNRVPEPAAPQAAPPAVAVTMGDPLGIGPQVVVGALCDPSLGPSCGVRWRVLGSGAVLDEASRRAGAHDAWRTALSSGHVELIDDGTAWPSGTTPHSPGPSADGGRWSFANLDRAIELVRDGSAAAIVTAPISKESWALAGVAHPGHTEVLAERFLSPRSAMLFVGPRLRVILVTIHIPLRRVPQVLTTARVRECIDLADECCRRMEPRRWREGVGRPRVAVAGLNPHAGEGGLFGAEDGAVIEPAVRAARESGIEASGPWPGDTVFSRAAAGEFDAVVAMYHDQGLIPVKLIDGRMAVNVTAGLAWRGRPVVRTSPAHGTAFDIAWQRSANRAVDATSMHQAAQAALRMLRAAPLPPDG